MSETNGLRVPGPAAGVRTDSGARVESARWSSVFSCTAKTCTSPLFSGVKRATKTAVCFVCVGFGFTVTRLSSLWPRQIRTLTFWPAT